MKHDHITIAVADAPRPGVEKVPARRVAENEWKLVRSPLYAIGVAAGDVIRIRDATTGAFDIVARGGNVCVQFYLGETEADDAHATAQAADAIARTLERLEGRLDAQTPGLIAFTVPVHVGFPAIEEVLGVAVADHPGAQWQYSNVYDPITGEPIG